MNWCGYIPESLNEGSGLRSVVFISGCRHACPGCFNPASWSFRAGEPFTRELQQSVIREAAANPLLDGLTLCGGDPFFSAADCIPFVRDYRATCPGHTIWAYTGFTFEVLIQEPSMLELARLCEVIVDGPFIEEEKDVSLPFRGSRNQRCVDVHSSLAADRVIDWQPVPL
ncbi:anaerobic ribonucleoside-triphosphate reductase activating protein [Paenibacillus sp. P96]|uniref:Anaerobic ribonucleoside-triphosphate reductase-activating protein n=1 Tax=Paenibacillus zeirhizosphaerae TaxID=2987519 RepID=A0ABT9FN96_9BACL|nr:anaerobic ribonucleoside-triphosphate reductase activating protein [Paenibacillus sp. P96]MDP4096180.1 anaerobic ribonucleoside-triphosphate reductase activating protein [Paenibacillus sp. P96]